LNFSPMIHRSSSPANLLVMYQRSRKWDQEVWAKFGQYNASVGNSFTYRSPLTDEENLNYPHSFTTLDGAYWIGKHFIHNTSLQVAAGPMLKNRLNATTYNYGLSNSFGYYFSNGLSIRLKSSYTIAERHHLQAHLSAPVISFNARSPYLGIDDNYMRQNYSHNGFDALVEYFKGAQIQSWSKAQEVDFDFSYYYRLSKKWEIGGMYLFSLNRNQSPALYCSVENSIYFSTRVKF